MSTESRRRTRRQWDEHFKIIHSDLKRNRKNDSSETGGREKGVVDFDSDSVDGKRKQSKRDFGIFSEISGFCEDNNVGQDESTVRGNNARKIIEEGEKKRGSDVACSSRSLRGKRKSDVKSENDGDGDDDDDDVEYLGEYDVSRSGSGRNAGGFDSGVQAKGGFRHTDDSVDKVKLVDLENSVTNSDGGSDEFVEQDESSGVRSVRRTRSGVHIIADSGNLREKNIEEVKRYSNLAGASRDLRGKRKSDVKSKNDDDDDVEFLGEYVVSRSGSGQNVGDLYSGVCGSGKFRRTDVAVDKVKFEEKDINVTFASWDLREKKKFVVNSKNDDDSDDDGVEYLGAHVGSRSGSGRNDGGDDGDEDGDGDDDDDDGGDGDDDDDDGGGDDDGVEYLGEYVVSGSGSGQNVGERLRCTDVTADKVKFVDSENLDTNSDGGSDEFVDPVTLESDSSSSKNEHTSDLEYKEDYSLSSDDSSSSEDEHSSDTDYKEDDESDGSYCLSDKNVAYDSDGDGSNGSSPMNWEEENGTNKIDEKKKAYSNRKSERVNGEKEIDLELEKDGESDEDSDKEAVVTIMNDVEKFPSVRRSPRINVSKNIVNDSSQSGLKKRRFCGSETVVDFDKSNGIEQISLEKHLRQRPISTSQRKESELKFGSLFSTPNSELLKRGQKGSQEEAKRKSKKTPAERNIDLIKILVDSIDSLKGEVPPPTEENDLTEEPLPLKFRFEDEVQPPPEKSEWEKVIDSLFLDMELCLRESESDYANFSATKNEGVMPMEIDNSPEACCGRGEHQPILDEQIGFRCRYCSAVVLEIQYVLPPFYVPPLRRNYRREFDESPCSVFGDVPFQDSARGPPDSFTPTKGTVWDLVSGVEKEMFPHQREGFEFMWKNLAGDINIEKLNRPLSDDGRGCIISHAPGTGKSRMTIVFLMSFLKLYPNCRPVIIAPRGMLLTWEDEFIKWKVDVAFHNLNNMELSGNEIRIAAKCTGQTGTVGMTKDKDYFRLVKIYSWMRGRSVLGISYKLFESLVGESGDKGESAEMIREKLLEGPGLLVLDEGHTPRNDQTLIWKALMKVSTQRRIILSGTPFQNNFTELYNTLCLVNPKFVHLIEPQYHQRHYGFRGRRSKVIRKKWMDLTSSIDKDGDRLKEIRGMLDSFVHLHKGTILQKSLPGLRDTIVFLHPTELQKTLLKIADNEQNVLTRTCFVSLISVHPSMVAEREEFSLHKNELEKIESDLDEGVKIKFLMKLISLADALNERVLIFSQFIDPLTFIKKMLKSHFGWNEGREVLYMDGKLDDKQRQESISSLNDRSTAAKVLLASEKACSEGINLVGASRVVLLDTVWNPSVERQAISRAYRLGQKRIVHVYRLIISGTEVRQYQLQAKKDRISQLIFSPADGKSCGNDASDAVSEDKILDSMLSNKSLRHIFDKTIHQPKESDLIETFGFVDL